MTSSTPIFTLEVPAYKSDLYESPGGSFTLTQPAPKIYLLAFNSPPENRLTPPFVDTFSLALDIVLTTLPPGILITTSSIPKFSSNGLDYIAAISDPNFFTNHLHPLWRRFLTFPMPTISIINGHNFGAGLMNSMVHDYRIMNPQKGFLCLPELNFDAPIPGPMAAIFKYKLPMTTFRSLILDGTRFTGPMALKEGIVDGLGGLEETLKFISERGLISKLRPMGKGSYGLVKEEMYRDLINIINIPEGQARVEDTLRTKERKLNLQESKMNVEKWKGKGGVINEAPKSKL